MNLDELDGNFQHLAWLVGAVRLTPHREAATLSCLATLRDIFSTFILTVLDWLQQYFASMEIFQRIKI